MNGNATEKSFKSLIDKSTLQHYTIHMPITEQFIESNNIKYYLLGILLTSIKQIQFFTCWKITCYSCNAQLRIQ